MPESGTERCPVCGRADFAARIWDDASRQLPVPGAEEVCVRGGDDPGEFEVFVHA